MGCLNFLRDVLPPRHSAPRYGKLPIEVEISEPQSILDLESVHDMLAELDGPISIRTIETYILKEMELPGDNIFDSHFIPGVDRFLEEVSELAKTYQNETTASLLAHNVELHLEKRSKANPQSSPTQHPNSVYFVFVLDIGTSSKPCPITVLVRPAKRLVHFMTSAERMYPEYGHRERHLFNKILVPLIRIICAQPEMPSISATAAVAPQAEWCYKWYESTRQARDMDVGVFAAYNALRFVQNRGLPRVLEGDKEIRILEAWRLRQNMREALEDIHEILLVRSNDGDTKGVSLETLNVFYYVVGEAIPKPSPHPLGQRVATLWKKWKKGSRFFTFQHPRGQRAYDIPGQPTDPRPTKTKVTDVKNKDMARKHTDHTEGEAVRSEVTTGGKARSSKDEGTEGRNDKTMGKERTKSENIKKKVTFFTH